jgi:hypothetical protein
VELDCCPVYEVSLNCCCCPPLPPELLPDCGYGFCLFDVSLMMRSNTVFEIR